MPEKEVILHVEDLKMHFPIKRGVIQRTVGYVHAVDGVTFDIYRGETLGLVGESGCGKTTAGRTILQLYKPTAGQIVFEGKDLVKLKNEEMRQIRRKIQMIFQDPYASLNPRMTVEEIISEPLLVHNIEHGKEIHDHVRSLLELVGLNPAMLTATHMNFQAGKGSVSEWLVRLP